MGEGRPNGRPAVPDIDVDRFDAAKRSSLDLGVENWPMLNGLTLGLLNPEIPRPTDAWRGVVEEGGGMATEDERRPCPCEPPRVMAKLWSTGSRPIASSGGRESGFSLHTAMN